MLSEDGVSYSGGGALLQLLKLLFSDVRQLHDFRVRKQPFYEQPHGGVLFCLLQTFLHPSLKMSLREFFP